MTAALQALHRFHGLRPEGRGSALPDPALAGTFTARQASLHAANRPVASPEGLLTLHFDAGRFPPAPAACYRAPWRLPGPDSHRLATTSFRPSQIISSRSLPISGRTPESRGTWVTARGGHATYWLPILGPSCTLAARRIADRLEAEP